MNYQYTSVDRIFTKLGRELTSDFDEGQVIEMIGESLEFIDANKSYEESIAFIEVINHQCDIPKGLHAIIQIAKNNHWEDHSGTPTICPATVAKELATEGTCGIGKAIDPFACDTDNDAVWIDCNGSPIVDYELAYYRPYFDFKDGFYRFTDSQFYRRHYTPIRLSTNSLHLLNNLVCRDYTDSYRCNSKDEYTVVGNKLRFSFRSGHIVLPYTRQMMDTKTGYPMIPDNISFTTAIVKYITMMKFEKEFYAGRDGAKGKLDKAESDWQWYCGQASCVDKMPNGVDEHQNLLDQRSYLLPDNNSYYKFFGNLNQPEPEHRLLTGYNKRLLRG